MKLKKMAELYISFFKIGGLTFGGGLAMLPVSYTHLTLPTNSRV